MNTLQSMPNTESLQNPEWNLTIGEIVAPFGLKGDVKVRLETDFPERYSRLRQICLRRLNGEALLAEIEAVRYHKGQVLLKLRGVDSIDAGDKLRGMLVQIRAQEAVRLPLNEYYIHDLVGCEVMTADGRSLGSLVDVLRTSAEANDVYVIGRGADEILLPAIRDVVSEVDLANRRIVVTPTPGLLAE